MVLPPVDYQYNTLSGVRKALPFEKADPREKQEIA